MTNFEPLLEPPSLDPLIKKLENILYRPFLYIGQPIHYTHKWNTVGYQSTPVNVDFGSVNA